MRIKKIFISDVPMDFTTGNERLTVVLENDRYEAISLHLSQGVEFLADNLRDLADRLTERSREKKADNHGKDKMRQFFSDNQNKFAKQHGLNRRCIGYCLRGKQKIHKGWTFKLVESN